ncbi:phage/plasmid primase, P4 family [Marinobacteraceae bacterium S3BR75-40.1]
MTEQLKTDIELAEHFLTLLDEEAEAFTFQTFADTPEAKAEDKERESKGQRKKYAQVFHGALSRHAAALERLNRSGAGVFITVNQTDLKGRKADNVRRVRAVFADTDGADLAPILNAKPEASFIVESSPGNAHPYWLTDGLPLAQFEGVQRRIADTYGTDSSVTDLPRVLRLPGFYHRKGEPFMVRMMQENGGLPYTADKILEAFPPLEKEGTSRQARQLEISEGDEILKALNDGGMVRSRRPDAGFNVVCPFEAEHSSESGQTETVYYPANTGGFKSPAFKCMHDHCTHRTLNDYREKLSLDQVAEPREFPELLATAQGFTLETEPEEIEALILECAALPAIRKRKVHEAIRKTTKLPFKAIQEAERQADEGSQADDLDLARGLVSDIGTDNVLAAQSFVWKWHACGVWKKQDERSVKQWVQHYIGDKVEAVRKSNVDSVADLFRTEIYMPDHAFDIGPVECVNTLSGELMLSGSGRWEILPHNRQHYRTTQVPVEYDPKAEAPQFVKFLADVFKNDPDAADKATALLEMMGYTLMAHCNHERFIILVGSGANGKSVLLSVLEALAGRDNVAAVQPSQFDNKFQRAHLHNKLANIVTEIKQGAVIDDDALKGITSGEPTTVEHKNKDPFDMRPFSTCWFGTNHMPHTRDFSDAVFRRALVVQFNNVFKPELGNCDPNLKNKLMAELPGILTLALDAYADALLEGFTVPQSCIDAREEWRLEADQVAQFVQDECEAIPEAKTPGSAMYGAYQEWATANGIHNKLANKAFKERMERLGFTHKRTNTARTFTGIRCKRAFVC